MSITLQWKVSAVSGSVSPTVTLSDKDATFGVRRTDTNEVVVAAGAAMTAAGGDVYTYTFAEPEIGLVYEYYVKVAESVAGTTNTYHVNGYKEGSPAWGDLSTLAGIRKMLVQETGRYDLVRDGFNDDFTDTGRADKYINEAQKWLDRRLPHHKSRSKLYKTVAAAESMITFGHARSVKEVYWYNTDTRAWEYLPWATLDAGLAPDHLLATVPPAALTDLPAGASNVVFGQHWPTNAIYVNPDDEKSRSVLIIADWYCPPLTADTDKSYWTMQHPFLLVRAASMLMEQGMRNTAGVKDYMDPIIDDLRQIYFDLTAEEAAGPAGAWRMRI